MESIHRSWNQRWGLEEARADGEQTSKRRPPLGRIFIGSMVARDGLEPPTRESSVSEHLQVALAEWLLFFRASSARS